MKANETMPSQGSSAWDEGRVGEQVSSMEKLPEPVYYVESPDDETVLVGIDVTIEPEKINDKNVAVVSWYDTVHQRRMAASETSKKDGYFAFRRIEQEGGGEYFFAPMDLELYNDKVKNRLTNGKDFDNKEDLIKAFLKTTENDV